MNVKLLQKEDFVWKEKKTNNIDSNPLEFWYTTYDDGTFSRLYYIIPQYPSKDGICIESGSEPELYVYFEAIGEPLEEGVEPCNYDSLGNGYVYGNGTFKRAFKSLEEAKARAYNDYSHIYGYVRSFIVD